jgi:hypothetical protein
MPGVGLDVQVTAGSGYQGFQEGGSENFNLTLLFLSTTFSWNGLGSLYSLGITDSPFGFGYYRSYTIPLRKP